MNCAFPLVPLSKVLAHRKESIEISDIETYNRCRVQLHARGIVLRDTVSGSQIKTKRQQVCRAGELLVAEIDAKVGGFGIVPDDLDGAIVSSHYFLFTIDESTLDPRFLGYYIRTPEFRGQVAAQGSTNYAAIRPRDVLSYLIPLPPLDEQRRIVAKIEELARKIEEARGLRCETVEELKALWAGWTWQVFSGFDPSLVRNVGAIAEVRGGIQKHSGRTPDKNPRRYITVAHVQRDHIDTTDPRYFEVSDEEFERWRLLPGDVLVGRLSWA